MKELEEKESVERKEQGGGVQINGKEKEEDVIIDGKEQKQM